MPEGAAADALALKGSSYIARRMNAFDVNGDLIYPESYESELRGATVIMRFTMEKFVVGGKQSGGKFPKEVFTANIASVRVITPPQKITPSPKMKTLYRKDPFAPTFDIKGKKKRVA